MGTAAAVMAKIAKVIASIIKKAAQAVSKAAGKTAEVTQQAGKAQDAVQKSANSIQRSASTVEKEASQVKDRADSSQRESRASGGTLGMDPEEKAVEKAAGKKQKDPAHEAQRAEEKQEKGNNISKEISKKAKAVATLGISKVVDKTRDTEETARGPEL